VKTGTTPNHFFEESEFASHVSSQDHGEHRKRKKMTYVKRAVFITVICLLFAVLPGYAAEGKLPVIDGKAAVATVNDEPITLEEFNRAIAASHAARPGAKTAGRIDYSKIINRIINTRLIILEARNIGLDDLPEIKKMVADYSQDTLMKLLLEGHVKDIKPDQAEMEKIYQEMVKEWQISSVRFKKEEPARNFEEKIKGGNNFEETVKNALDEGIAEEGKVGQIVKDKDLEPQIAQVVSKMEIGSTSSVVTIGKKGFIIIRLEGIRFPEEEDAEAMKRARLQVLNQERVKAAKAYYQDLRKKYAKINEELVDGLDYESEEPGFDSLLEDKRVIVEISGEEPVTVGELTKGLKQKFFHGVERAIKAQEVNKKKYAVLEGIVEERILLKEALIKGINNSDEYKDEIKEYEISLVFGAFINKVIVPDIKLDQKELKSHYQENIKNYTSPEMMRIKELVFESKSDAVSAVEKLRRGTDFDWLSSKAEGQVDKNTKGLLRFKGELLTVDSLPEGVQKTLSGANPGDFKLYESPEGYFYVLYIYHLLPGAPRPFESVRNDIAKDVIRDKVRKAVEAYADQLKEYYPVKIYAKDLQ
jgi:hypothetical protein